MIDVRSPGEFLKGAFPTACNIPLLIDEERAAVGLCYKRNGQEAAIDLGHKLVTETLREERLAAWVSLAKLRPEGSLYCFRGGLRSSIVQKWLDNEGVSYPLVNGGYKAMRRFLIEALEKSLSDIDLVLVSGRTGVGKTRVIDKLDRGIDLERLAKHRGSTFGKLLEKQPSQISFENELSISILKTCARSKAPIFIEDEGKLIGRINLPNKLRLSMEQAPIVFVRASPIRESLTGIMIALIIFISAKLVINDELKLVIWPSRQQLFSESIAVILMVTLSAAAIAAVSRFYGWGASQIFH